MTHASTSIDFKRPRALVALAVFVIGVIGVGAIIGTQTAPGAWYAGLEKPPFNPPNWVFGPVWFTLYVLIAIAGWRTFLIAPLSVGMGLWAGQMLLNWIWSPVFFAAQSLWLAMVVIVPMLAIILAYSVNRWRYDRVSSLLFIPYAAWVGFATLLNASLIVLNT